MQARARLCERQRASTVGTVATMRILITGTSGLIGSRLVHRCREAGHEVIATARQPSAALEKALGLFVRPLDVLKPATATAEIEADAIVHCATANDILSRDFAVGVNLSVLGTRHLLELASMQRIPRFIFLSTLQVYGTELIGEVTEVTPPHCETPYGLNHLLGEETCRLYVHRDAALSVTLLRPANVYGVPDSPTVERSTLVPMCFVKEALATGRLVLRSSGLQRRNFVSTDQVASACIQMLAEPSLPGATVVNIASRWIASILDIALMTADVHRERTGSDLPIERLSDLPHEGNAFTLRSRLEALAPSIDQSMSHMRDVINRLYDHFQHQP